MDDEEPQDDEYSLVNGSADAEAEVACPYCGEVVVMVLDPGGGPVQQYVEDCPVCCRPWQVSVRYDDEGQAEVELRAEDGDEG
jgi:hypothetical protein